VASDLILCSTSSGSILVFDLYSEIIKEENDPQSTENSRIMMDSMSQISVSSHKAEAPKSGFMALLKNALNDYFKAAKPSLVAELSDYWFEYQHE
jgi:hypothetical protein